MGTAHNCISMGLVQNQQLGENLFCLPSLDAPEREEEILEQCHGREFML